MSCKRSDERERHALFQLDFAAGSRGPVRQATSWDKARPTPAPRVATGGASEIATGPALAGNGAHRASRELVDADVGPDAIEPRTNARARGWSDPRSPSTNERLLDHVVRVVRGAEHAVAVEAQLVAVRWRRAGRMRGRSSRAGVKSMSDAGAWLLSFGHRLRHGVSRVHANIQADRLGYGVDVEVASDRPRG